MKRFTLPLLVIVVLAAVGGAGYLGMRGVQVRALPTVELPTTIRVTRGEVQQTVTAPGRVISTRQLTLTPETCGRLTRVDVHPGDEVRRGEVLAQFDVAHLEEELSSAQADLEVAQARLSQIKAGPSPAELEAARYTLLSAETLLNELRAGPSAAEVAAAQSDVASAQAELHRLRSLPGPLTVAQAQAELDRARVALQQAQAAYDQVQDRPEIGMLPQALELQKATIAYNVAHTAFEVARQPATAADLEATRARLVSAQARLGQIQAGSTEDELRLAELAKSKAEAELAQLTAGPSAADLRQAQLAVSTAQRAVENAHSDLRTANLVAPFGGIVLDVQAGAGETVCPSDRFITLMDPSALEVEATVIEEDLPVVRVGQTAELFFDAQPGALISGHVSRIVPQRSPAGDRPLYPVYLELDDLPERVAPGMTADASIIIARRADVLRLPRTLAHTRPDGTAQIGVWTGGEIETRTILVGLCGDVYIEVLEGLQEGEEVVGQ